MKLSQLLDFVKITNDLQKIERIVLIKGINRWENDVEHSYQLAMIAWYIAETDKLKMNLNKLLQYSLVHDFVEVYAGDTYAYKKGKNVKAEKEKREHAAALKLKKVLPEFKSLHKLIETYKKREDKESKFIYALDKIVPALNIYLDNGKTWRKMGITIAMQQENKKGKIDASPEIKAYWKEMAALFQKEEKRLFGKKSKK